MGRGLTALGLEELARGGRRCDVGAGDEVFLVWLFDGLGAPRCAWELLGLPLAAFVSVDCDPQARRVVASAWPHAIMVENVEAAIW